ncbi:hypothetical protein N7530_006547 [Penicillium desertorum]|uniref:UBX domain-containing protein 2 n=1 Tax=Penicillium desertorum TaxID=1303715 RepID=A0A9W9WRV8_9EURO|nr:hypothetical protein N7530_006547 [Penicillium desertorum]
MTLFYAGSLQEGIAAAVRDVKAVTCFVRDDKELSSQWEDAYFGDDEVAQALNAKAVVLRLTAGSQEAGFLASFCPISKFPTVVLIKNGTLKEYIGPDISKDDFRSRLIAALENEQTPSPTQPLQGNDTPTASTNNTPPDAPSNASKSAKQASETAMKKQPPIEKISKKTAQPVNAAGSTLQKQLSSQGANNKDIKGKAPMGSKKPTDKAVAKSEQQEPKPIVPRGPPTEYRLQVRLFDGSSVRSSFTPTQTIRNDVRAWLDQKMEGDNRPYNLKHILTPPPQRNSFRLGSTANLVMVPVSTYTEAYSAAGSLPVRGISAVYNLASSAASTATGLVGSFLGYGSTAPASGADTPSASPATGNSQRPRNAGPNIRTLRDQQDGRGNSQLYNGNQLNFEPRKNQDDKDK